MVTESALTSSILIVHMPASQPAFEFIDEYLDQIEVPIQNDDVVPVSDPASDVMRFLNNLISCPSMFAYPVERRVADFAAHPATHARSLSDLECLTCNGVAGKLIG